MSEDVKELAGEIKEELKAEAEPSPELMKFLEIIDKYGDRILDILEKHSNKGTELEKLRHEHWYSTVKLITFLAGLLVAGVSILAWQGRLSSDAIAFLFGTIAGYLFSIFGGLVGKAKQEP